MKTPAALHSNKSQPCRKKKKCLSDIFGHMIGASKETSVITKVADQVHTTTCALKEEAEDSPYADLESVPVLQRPKRAAVSPTKPSDGPVRIEEGSAPVRAQFTEEASRPTGSDSPPRRDLGQSEGGSKENAAGSCTKHSVSFPASSGLMTRALKAEEDTDPKDVRSKLGPRGPADASPSSAAHGSPKRRARKPDKKRIRNGSLTAPKSTGPGGFEEQPAHIKAENVPRPVSSPSPPPVSPPEALEDVKELMFKSLVKEESSSSELTGFRPDANYKFSTFLMLLKDMHDTREKEGKPLTLPPSPVLIKEEPLVIPTAAGGDHGTCERLTQGIKVEAGQAERATVLHSSAAKPKKRTKPIMSSGSYHFHDFPTNSQVENSDRQHRKRRLPAKLKPAVPGLSSDLTGLAYVAGHAGEVDASGPPGLPDISANYLDKNCGASAVAPKKRWQMVEDDESKSEVRRRASLEMNGSFITPSPDLNLEGEKQGNNDSFFSETHYSTAGKKKKNKLMK